PAGLQLTLDGQPVTSPFSVLGVVGIQRTLGAISPQTQGGTTYQFSSGADGRAATAVISTPLADSAYTASYQVTTTPPGVGLLGTYWDNINFTGTSFTRVDGVVNFNFGTGAPMAGMGADTFSVRWTGQVRAKVTGTYTFFTTSDDGVRLFVNGTQVINNFTDHAATENSGTIALTAGQLYDIRM